MKLLSTKEMEKIILLTMAALCLSGCGIYTKYKRPEEVKPADSYRNAAVSDTTNMARLSWTALFRDTCLQNLIRHGLSNNMELRIARLKVKEAKAVLSASRKAFLPSLSLSADGSLSSFDGASPGKTYSAGANASWEIDAFGKLTNEKRSSQDAWLKQDAYRQAVQTQLVATIADSYYTLLMLDEQLKISRQTIINWENNIRVLNALKKAGKTTEAAINQAKANKLSVESSVVLLEKEIQNVENSLSVLLGIPPAPVDRGQLPGQEFPEALATGIPLQLLSNRPDIKQYEYALEEAFYGTNKARSAFYPALVLSGSAGWTNSAGSIIVNPAKTLLTALGSLTQPIFNKGVNQANLEIAKARQEEAMLAFQQKILEAGAEVNDALLQWQTARKRIRINSGQIRELENAVRNTNLTMRYDSTTYLEVLNAEQSLLAARLTDISDRFDEIQGVIMLYHALGGGIIE